VITHVDTRLDSGVHDLVRGTPGAHPSAIRREPAKHLFDVL
jgi:hypothetical protein